MTEQDIMNETSLSTSNSISHERNNLPKAENDTSEKHVVLCHFKNGEEETMWIEKNPDKGTICGKDHIDDSTAKKTLSPAQDSEVKMSYPAEEATKTVSGEEPWKNMPVCNSQDLSNTVYASAATVGTESTDLNSFICDSSDLPLCDTEANPNTELSCLPYPSTFDSTERSGMDDKPYGCKYCIRRFAHSSSLYRHQKSHMETKLYKCTQCNKAFTSASNLNVHSRIHTGLKPYECSDCGKRFTRKFGLDQHLKIHSQEKLYICSHCGKSYTDYFFLVKHQQMERASVPYS